MSYEIFVPRQADLNVKTHNGGISIAGVRGNIQFSALNGGVTLKQLGGDVEGNTMNGGLSIELAGDRWDGNKLDARTTNGGVNVTMPERYSAHFETGTANGRLNVDFPMTVHGEIGKQPDDGHRLRRRDDSRRDDQRWGERQEGYALIR